MTHAERVTGRAIRRIVLEQSNRAHVGHIGSALSVADILASLYGSVLRVKAPDDPDRDRFLLSKGHAALALYAALHLRGWVGRAELDSYCGDGTLLGVHPEHSLAGVDFSTGSLGLGLSFAAGAALGARLAGSPRRAFALLSDAECNEGSTWEAAMFAAHHRLANLFALVDENGQQALGYTRDVLDLSPLEARWEAFGWDVVGVDGNDAAAVTRAIAGADSRGERPHAVVCHTVFGKGVSFMERKVKWHYSPMSAEEYERAMREIEAG
ncbi:MAG TPA: transketolase [Thermoanaerobaculaceae bacterium]|nr:transketolase [Thermoanaerobaculaceae bacterium]